MGCAGKRGVRMTRVSVFEQECFGVIHYRVMRDDGRLIFDRHQTDFPSESEAVDAILGEFRRKQLGQVRVRVVSRDRKTERVVAA